MQRIVILSDYGGPVTQAEVRPYLYNLFSDRRILAMPGFVRKPLAFLISRLRARKAKQIYARIDGSPVNGTVSEICRSLNEEQDNLRFVPGFQYIRPFLKDVARRMEMTGGALVFPTFPHDSFSTYGSVRDAVRKAPSTRVAGPYYNDEQFLELLTESVRQVLDDWRPEDCVILCTAHSVPVSYVKRGDVYIDQVTQQVELLRERLPGYDIQLSYQSPLGPVEWVGPFLEDEVQRLAESGVRNLVVLPLSFTVDNSETLYELDMLIRDLAVTMGIEIYRRVPCLNNDAGFRRFLLDRAAAELEARKAGQDQEQPD